MGTNFYRIKTEAELEEDVKNGVEDLNQEGEHIGKRSAAGMYCWDCGVTLNVNGEFWVHQSIKSGHNRHWYYSEDKHNKNPDLFNPIPKREDFDSDLDFNLSDNSEWFKRCPSCGKKHEKEPSLSEGSGAVELGFAKPNDKKQSGVQTVSSFSWAVVPYEFKEWLEDEMNNECIMDEYGRKMTGKEFMEMLEHNCPIQYYYSLYDEFC